MAARKAISTASRSMLPVCFRSAKMRASSVVTSRAISWWIASAVFFLRRQGLFGRSQSADVLIDFHKSAVQFLIFPKLSDLLFRLFHRCGRRQRLADGLALYLVSQAQGRAVARIVRLGAMTGRLATATHDSGNRTGPEVAES